MLITITPSFQQNCSKLLLSQMIHDLDASRPSYLEYIFTTTSWPFLDAGSGVKLCYLPWLLVSFFAFWLFLIPSNVVKDLTDVGFHHLGNARGRGARVSRSRKARFVGTKIPPPYPNGWLGVVESKDLKIGQVLAVDCFGENLAVFRAEDGTAHCVDAYCPHLGANMAAGGAVRGSCIECPFHRWQFSGDTGECLHIPGTEKVPRGIGVRKWLSSEVDGMIFVWYNGPRMGPRRVPETPPSWNVPHIEEIKNGRWGFRGRNEFIINCHIQDIPENGADVAHLDAVHGTSMLFGGDLTKTNGYVRNLFGRHVWSASWSPSGDDSHVAIMKLNHDINIVGKLSIIGMHVSAKQIGPGYVRLEVITTFGPLVILQTVTPLGPMTQKVVHRMYAPWYIAPYAGIILWGEGIMFERDIMVWNNKSFISNPSYVKTDKTIRAYRSWYSQFYSEDSTSFEDAINPLGKSSPFDW